MTDMQKSLMDQYHQDLLGVFGDPGLVIEKGNGCLLEDVNGKRYLDLLAGIAVNALGYAHPRWVKAVNEQASRLAHISNLFTTPQQIALGNKLSELFNSAEPVQAFFCNSGTEANEAAYKLARRFANQHGKKTILALDHGFHGRTVGALSLTWKPAYREPFEPLPAGIKHIPATIEALEENLTDDVAALFVEPIQGEAGVLPLPVGYLQKARELTRQKNALLIVDEVQTGVGRTGRWLECTRELDAQSMPDAITLAKGLGGGFPIGALLVNGAENLSILQAGMHGTTFGGNPLACAAALATLSVIEEENLLASAQHLGDSVRAHIEKVVGVASTSGAGLLIGIQLESDVTASGDPLAPRCVNIALEKGFILNATDAKTLRIAPPLIISAAEMTSFADALGSIIAEAAVS